MEFKKAGSVFLLLFILLLQKLSWFPQKLMVFSYLVKIFFVAHTSTSLLTEIIYVFEHLLYSCCRIIACKYTHCHIHRHCSSCHLLTWQTVCQTVITDSNCDHNSLAPTFQFLCFLPMRDYKFLCTLELTFK